MACCDMPAPGTIDPLLQGFLYAPEAEFREGLARLLAEQAQPIVQAILRSRQRGDIGDSLDLHEEVTLSLIERLHGLRRRPQEAPPANFRNYVAAVTYYALAERRRRASRERHRMAAGSRGDPLDHLPDPRADAAMDFDLRTRLRRLWSEIRQLPPRQCAALILNLRDEQGKGAVVLLPLTGTASMRQIAAVLEMPAARFAQLWNRLPLDDAAIGEMLGATRQQVINLRKAARARLARRMRRIT
jgi:DNA-directed RNA polymerase specialized sigma24 family protein